MMDEIKKRARIVNVAGTAAMVALLAGSVAFGVTPLWRAGMKDVHDTATLREHRTELDILALKVARVQEEQKARETRLEEAEAHLPTQAGMSQFVPDLAKVAEEAGLQVDNVVPVKEAKTEGVYKMMSVRVSGSGSWETCYKFLTALRGTNEKLIRLDSLTMETSREKGVERPVCRITVDLSTLMVR